MSTGRNYLFAGGGTGGHLTPGLAVAAELQRADPGCRILFTGSDRPLERAMIATAWFEHVPLPVESLQALRRNPIRFILGNWRAWRQAKAILRQEQPDAVIGLGGFASAPLVAAATRSRIPTILLEQNAIPGKTNRWLAPRVNTVCLSLEESAAWFDCSCRMVITGNPVRHEIAELMELPPIPSTDETLLVLGGSQGATGLNAAVREMIQGNVARWKRRRVVHQTGPADADSFTRLYTDLGIEHLVRPFFDDMGLRYRQATLVVSRAGATTLAELACAGLPSILVPYPHAADDHQRHNAGHYVSAGGARLALQQSLPEETARTLAELVESLWSDRAGLAAMRAAMRTAARPRAAQGVVQVLQTAIQARIT